MALLFKGKEKWSLINVDESIDSDKDVLRMQDQVLRNRCDLELLTYK